MTAEEFSITLRKHRHNTKFGKKLAEKSDSGLVLDGRNVKATDQDFRKTNAQITAKIFDNKQHLTMDEYFAIRDDLQEALWHYEFY